MLVGGLGDPINSWVVANGSVGWVNHNNLEPLVDRVLSNPVGIQDSQRTALASSSLLCNRTKVSDELLLSDTGVLWLTVVDTLGHSLLSVTSLNSDSVDDIALLGLVSQTMSLVRARWLASPVDGWKLSVLPSTKSEDESHHIGLLLIPELLKVLVCSH